MRVLAHAAALLAGAAIAPAALAEDMPVLWPNGPVAETQRTMIFEATALMAIVVIPVFVLTAVFIWRYRASAPKGKYRPQWTFSWPIDIAIWAVPALIVMAIGTMVWSRTHSLDPYKPLPGAEAPLRIEAVALDWKWLFIYPEQQVAALNELVVPANRSFTVAITSDTVMNAFYIPGLGGQIYAMAGMESRMNLLAEKTGPMWGRNTQYSGEGFSDQRFDVRVVEEADFTQWIAEVGSKGTPLDAESYAAVAKPSQAAPVAHFAPVAPGLFKTIIAKYNGPEMPHGQHGQTNEGARP